jgi:DNA-binding XRE family transcriptional regulator
MCGAFALGLIVARNANPDADVLRRIIFDAIFLHILLHTRKRIPITRKKCRQTAFILYDDRMLKEKSVSEKDLAALAKRFRKQAGKKRAQAAREMGVAQTSIFQAEEKSEQALFKLRSRMIEKYSKFKVVGPIFLLRAK